MYGAGDFARSVDRGRTCRQFNQVDDRLALLRRFNPEEGLNQPEALDHSSGGEDFT